MMFYLFENTTEKNLHRRAETARGHVAVFQLAPGCARQRELGGPGTAGEPILPGQRGMERNLPPDRWSFWREQKNATNGCQKPVVVLESLPS